MFDIVINDGNWRTHLRFKSGHDTEYRAKARIGSGTTNQITTIGGSHV